MSVHYRKNKNHHTKIKCRYYIGDRAEYWPNAQQAELVNLSRMRFPVPDPRPLKNPEQSLQKNAYNKSEKKRLFQPLSRPLSQAMPQDRVPLGPVREKYVGIASQPNEVKQRRQAIFNGEIIHYDATSSPSAVRPQFA